MACLGRIGIRSRERGGARAEEGGCVTGATSGIGNPSASQFENSVVSAPADAYAPLRARSEFEPTFHGDGSLPEPNQRALAPIHRPPSVMLDEQESLQFHA